MNREPVQAVLALGANVGDRAGNLRAALTLLAERGITIERVSSCWETAPVPADQPPFYNAVATVSTVHAPLDLLAQTQEVEHLLGRRPGRRWGPRPADVDILFYGGERIDLPRLQVPHPRIAERGFVLAPLSEVVEGPLPVLGRTALELLAAAGCEGLVRTAITLWP